MRLSGIFDRYFRKHTCEAFHAVDIKLTKDDYEPCLVIPDLVVTCQKENWTHQQYNGVPALIVEILSPSNRKHDLLVKMNLYAKFGVKEYWIIDPVDRLIMLFDLHETGQYILTSSNETGNIHSAIFPDLVIDVDDLFDF